ncbi:hypothetical protein BD626DRAFT_564221 [Schizophyllum amplum]|uniref:Uncharacterized protein n=1 Tax=Schizophyllum amplum TaxID=97359 RepID=A0A550D0Q4_9AGAR|nr:hypothetical protein BD626DRAFT_564221 [Auriculariopsis ampla]
MTCLTFEYGQQTVYIPRPRTYRDALVCAREAFPELTRVPDRAIVFMTHWRLHGRRMKWQAKPIVIPEFTWTTIIPVMAQGLAIILYVHPTGTRRRGDTPETTPPDSPIVVQREVEPVPVSIRASTASRGRAPTEPSPFTREPTPLTRGESPYMTEHTPLTARSRPLTREHTPEHEM